MTVHQPKAVAKAIAEDSRLAYRRFWLATVISGLALFAIAVLA